MHGLIMDSRWSWPALRAEPPARRGDAARRSALADRVGRLGGRGALGVGPGDRVGTYAIRVWIGTGRSRGREAVLHAVNVAWRHGRADWRLDSAW